MTSAPPTDRSAYYTEVPVVKAVVTVVHGTAAIVSVFETHPQDANSDHNPAIGLLTTVLFETYRLLALHDIRYANQHVLSSIAERVVCDLVVLTAIWSQHYSINMRFPCISVSFLSKLLQASRW